MTLQKVGLRHSSLLLMVHVKTYFMEVRKHMISVLSAAGNSVGSQLQHLPCQVILFALRLAGQNKGF